MLLKNKAQENIVEIIKIFQFEAAHNLSNVPPDHKCGRLHGHLFIMEIKVRSIVNPANSWVMDFADISSIVRPLIDKYLDHYYLNDIPKLGEPTSESLAT